MAIKARTILYSPYPPTDYAVTDGKYCGGYGARGQLVGDLAVWNLLWLSEPAVDALLTWPTELAMHAPLCSPVSRASVETAEQHLGEAPVRELVTALLPSQFWKYLEAHRKLAKPLSLHKLLGAEWLHRVEARAGAYRGRLESNGSVVQVSFARRPSTTLQAGPKLGAEVLEM